MKYYKISVRCRDDPNQDTNFDDGFISDWSEPLYTSKEITNINIIRIADFLTEFPFLKNLFFN